MSAKKAHRWNRCSLEVRDIPLEFFQHPRDKKRWRQAARSRHALLLRLSMHANPDGTFTKQGKYGEIDFSPSAKRLERHLASRTMYLHMDDLRDLGLLSWDREQKHYGRRKYTISIPEGVKEHLHRKAGVDTGAPVTTAITPAAEEISPATTAITPATTAGNPSLPSLCVSVHPPSKEPLADRMAGYLEKRPLPAGIRIGVSNEKVKAELEALSGVHSTDVVYYSWVAFVEERRLDGLKMPAVRLFTKEFKEWLPLGKRRMAAAADEARKQTPEYLAEGERAIKLAAEIHAKIWWSPSKEVEEHTELQGLLEAESGGAFEPLPDLELTEDEKKFMARLAQLRAKYPDYMIGDIYKKEYAEAHRIPENQRKSFWK